MNPAEHNDRPRAEIMKMAEDAIKKFASQCTKATVYFKFTCSKCGARCQFADPNMLYERGECYVCGHEAPVNKAGFALHLEWR